MGNQVGGRAVDDRPTFLPGVLTVGIKHLLFFFSLSLSRKSESEAVSRPGQGVPKAVVVIAQSAGVWSPTLWGRGPGEVRGEANGAWIT